MKSIEHVTNETFTNFPKDPAIVSSCRPARASSLPSLLFSLTQMPVEASATRVYMGEGRVAVSLIGVIQDVHVGA